MCQRRHLDVLAGLGDGLARDDQQLSCFELAYDLFRNMHRLFDGGVQSGQLPLFHLGLVTKSHFTSYYNKISFNVPLSAFAPPRGQ